jgi:hypothetical protein
MEKKSQSRTMEEMAEEVIREKSQALSSLAVEVPPSKLGRTWQSSLSAEDAERIWKTYIFPTELIIRIPNDDKPAIPRVDNETPSRQF